jgi:hypothetical protein
MKKLRNVVIAASIIICAVAMTSCSSSKNVTIDQVTDSARIRSMINSQNFIFVAQYVSPMGFRRRYLTPDYDVRVSRDTVVSYLPFFGRGYTAPLSPSDADFDFTSTKFSYTMSTTRKGWTISIKPTDQHYLQELYFRIFNNGSASLNVTSIDRSFISYDGYIAARRIKEPKKQ